MSKVPCRTAKAEGNEGNEGNERKGRDAGPQSRHTVTANRHSTHTQHTATAHVHSTPSQNTVTAHTCGLSAAAMLVPAQTRQPYL